MWVPLREGGHSIWELWEGEGPAYGASSNSQVSLLCKNSAPFLALLQMSYILNQYHPIYNPWCSSELTGGFFLAQLKVDVIDFENYTLLQVEMKSYSATFHKMTSKKLSLGFLFLLSFYVQG